MTTKNQTTIIPEPGKPEVTAQSIFQSVADRDGMMQSGMSL